MPKKVARKPPPVEPTDEQIRVPEDQELMIGLMQKREDLLPELKPYRTRGGLLGQMINHPLLQCPILAEGFYAHANYAYRAAESQLEELRRKKDYFGAVFCYTIPSRLEGFRKEITAADDKTYWKVLGAVWVAAEFPWHDRKLFLDCFTEPRPHREHMMDLDERKAFGKLSDQLTVYRGFSGNRGKGLSWTLDRAKAVWFAKRFQALAGQPGRVIEGVCEKADAFAYFTGRGESEIVIDPDKVKRQRKIPLEVPRAAATHSPRRRHGPPSASSGGGASPPPHDPAAIMAAILDDYALPVRGFHGVVHWARVLENGLRIAEANGADREVVTLFALFHDSRRVNEDRDDGHGLRGAELARSLRGKLVHLDDDRFELLYEACRLHTEGHTTGDKTLLACWDADRLDLGRVGITPDPRRLGTKAARNLLAWAHDRAVEGHEPAEVLESWDVE